jgi:serine/tyrosine/threonine adenylyltransferase
LRPLGFFFDLMREINPAIIANNYLVENALESAVDGELEPFMQLPEALKHSYDKTLFNEDFRTQNTPINLNYKTFCGT